MVIFWKYAKLNILLKLFLYFYILNLATRKLKIMDMTRVIFLLDSNTLDKESVKFSKGWAEWVSTGGYFVGKAAELLLELYLLSFCLPLGRGFLSHVEFSYHFSLSLPYKSTNE